MASDFNVVLDQLRYAKVAGESRERAEQIARSHGWTLDKLKAAAGTSTAGNVARAVGQGATFGFGDELAALASTTTGQPYQEALQRERAGLARFQSTNPKTAMALELGGSVAPGLAAAPLAVGKTALGTAGRMAGVGAAEGALYGAGVGETADERVNNAAWGAGVGAAASPAIALGGASINRVTGAVRNAVSPSGASRKDIHRALVRDEMTPDQLIAENRRLQALKPGEATVADAGGPAMRGLVERAANSASAGRSAVKPFLEERQRRQLQRITNDLQRLTGTVRTARTAIEDTVTARAQAAAPKYEAALEFDPRTDPRLMEAWTRATRSGHGADILASRELRNNIETEYGVPLEQAPPMVVMHEWYKELGDRITAAKANDKAANRARILKDMQAKVRTELVRANPAYGEALDAWSGPSAYLDAVTAGQKILSMPADEMKALLGGLTAGEREGFRTGAVSALIARMERDGAKLTDYTKFYRSEGMRKKLDALLGDAKTATRWRDLIGIEEGFTEMTVEALGNSATARRMMQQADAQGLDVFDVLLTAADGTGIQAAVRRWLSQAAARGRDTLRSRVDAKNAERLMSPDAARMLADIGRRPLLAGISDRAAGLPPAFAAALAASATGEFSSDEFPY